MVIKQKIEDHSKKLGIQPKITSNNIEITSSPPKQIQQPNVMNSVVSPISSPPSLNQNVENPETRLSTNSKIKEGLNLVNSAIEFDCKNEFLKALQFYQQSVSIFQEAQKQLIDQNEKKFLLKEIEKYISRIQILNQQINQQFASPKFSASNEFKNTETLAKKGNSQKQITSTTKEKENELKTKQELSEEEVNEILRTASTVKKTTKKEQQFADKLLDKLKYEEEEITNENELMELNEELKKLEEEEEEEINS